MPKLPAAGTHATSLLPPLELTFRVSQINRRLEEESTRAQSYLKASTEPLLMSLLDNVLIEQHLASILEHPASGLSTLIQDSRIEDLKLLYTLFGRVGKGHPALQAGVSAWIVAIGKQINEGVSLAPEPETRAEDAKGKGKAAEESEGAKKKPEAGGAINAKTKAALAWVQNVLDLKDKFDTLLAKAFASDKAFEKSINDAFSVFVNENRKSPEYISLFIDDNLRKGLKGVRPSRSQLAKHRLTRSRTRRKRKPRSTRSSTSRLRCSAS